MKERGRCVAHFSKMGINFKRMLAIWSYTVCGISKGQLAKLDPEIFGSKIGKKDFEFWIEKLTIEEIFWWLKNFNISFLMILKSLLFNQWTMNLGIVILYINYWFHFIQCNIFFKNRFSRRSIKGNIDFFSTSPSRWYLIKSSIVLTSLLY